MSNPPAAANTRWQQNVLVFDLETMRSFDEVGGRDGTRKLGMSLGVVYNYRTDAYETYREDRVQALIDALLAADRVIGFNVVKFDFEVLRGYRDVDFRKVETTDMLLDIEKTLGHRVPLDALATATLNAKKSGHGLEAIRWYQEGRWDDLERYCRDDVKITKELYDFGAKNGHLLFESRYSQGAPTKVETKWPVIAARDAAPTRVQGRLF